MRQARSAPLNVRIVDTAARDGLQRRRILPANCDKADALMESAIEEHLMRSVQAGIRDFDLVSVVHPQVVPIMRAVRRWLPNVLDNIRRECSGDLNIQALLMTANPAYSDVVRDLAQAGYLQSAAYVHSHDPYVLWKNSGIRRDVEGTPIPEHVVYGNVPEKLAEEMRQISRGRYEAIYRIFEDLGIRLNVYQMNATGSHDRLSEEPLPIDPQVITREIDKMPLLEGSRHIICDTEAIGTPELLRDLMTALRDRVGKAVGLHLHVLNNMAPLKVRELVRASIEPLVDREALTDCYVETGIAGLGGCTVFTKPNQNVPIGSVVQAVDALINEGVATWHGTRPDLDLILESVAPHIVAWDRQLKELGEISFDRS